MEFILLVKDYPNYCIDIKVACRHSSSNSSPANGSFQGKLFVMNKILEFKLIWDFACENIHCNALIIDAQILFYLLIKLWLLAI